MAEVLGAHRVHDPLLMARMHAYQAGPAMPGKFPSDDEGRRWHIVMYGHMAGKFRPMHPDGAEIVEVLLAEARDKGLLPEDMELWDRAVAVGQDHPFSADEIAGYDRAYRRTKDADEGVSAYIEALESRRASRADTDPDPDREDKPKQ